MIRICLKSDFEKIYEVINDSACAYKDVISSHFYKEPYMTREELKKEIEDGVGFWCYEEKGEIAGVMGIQNVSDVTLIRHSYVRTKRRNHGIGEKLLSDLRKKTERPILIGTWRNADWAVSFYEKNGFKLVSEKEKDSLLRKYWRIPESQIKNSVVLAEKKWFNISKKT